MKTIRSFSMTFNPTLTMCLVLAVIWNVMAVPGPAFGGKGKGKGGKVQNIEVRVEFRDTVGDGVKSDTGNPYLKTKRNKVKAFIQQDGQLNLHTWDSKERWMRLYIPDPDGDGFPQLDPERVHANLVTLDINLLDVGPGGSTATQVSIFFPDSFRGTWELLFGVTVFGNGGGPRSWDIETNGAAFLIDHRGNASQGTPQPIRTVTMPFGITVTALE